MFDVVTVVYGQYDPGGHRTDVIDPGVEVHTYVPLTWEPAQNPGGGVTHVTFA
jgi:hypothetical protein